MQAALMACVELFGAEGYRYEGIDSSSYRSWTRASIRTECEKYIFATSEELIRSRHDSIDRADEKAPVIDQTSSPSPAASLKPVDPLPNGKKYLSELNQLCQKLNWPLPVFYYASVNTVNNYFVCCVRGFHDLPPMESAPFTKKNLAKEDVAGRIYLRLKERGFMEEANRIYREKRRALDQKADNQNKNQSVSQGHHTQGAQSPSQSQPMSPPVNAPFAMMQMMSMMPVLSTLMAQSAQNPGNQELQAQINQMWQQMALLCMNGMSQGMTGMSGMPQAMNPIQMAQAMNPMSPNSLQSSFPSAKTSLFSPSTSTPQQTTPPMPSTFPPSNNYRRYDSYRPIERDDNNNKPLKETDYDRSFEEGELKDLRDGRDIRDARDARDDRDARDYRNVRDGRDYRRVRSHHHQSRSRSLSRSPPPAHGKRRISRF
jgi:hypothetical protein